MRKNLTEYWLHEREANEKNAMMTERMRVQREKYKIIKCGYATATSGSSKSLLKLSVLTLKFITQLSTLYGSSGWNFLGLYSSISSISRSRTPSEICISYESRIQ